MTDKTVSYPLALPVAENPYRTLLFFSNHGKSFACLTAALVCLAGIALWWSGHGVAWIAAGLIGGGFTLVLMNCLAEMVQLIVDTMIPK